MSPNDASSPDLGRVRRVLRAAEDERTIAGPAGRHPLWVTEFWWTSSLNSFDDFKPKLRRQARYIQQSMYLFWKAGAKVAIYLSLMDSSDFPTGLFLEDRTPKPAAQAFSFPFVTERRSGDLRAWGKSPLTGRLRIERRGQAGWHRIESLNARAGEVFEASLQVQGPVRVRASVGTEHSLAWNQR